MPSRAGSNPSYTSDHAEDGSTATLTCARLVTTTSAPASRSACDCPLRSTPMTQPNPPARPAATPTIASSTTTARDGSALTRCAASRNASGAGLPLRARRVISIPSTRASNSCDIPAASSTAAQLLLEDTTAVLISCARSVSNEHDRRFIGLDAVLLQVLQEVRVLEIA